MQCKACEERRLNDLIQFNEKCMLDTLAKTNLKELNNGELLNLLQNLTSFFESSLKNQAIAMVGTEILERM